MAAATAEKKMIVSKVFLAGRGFRRTPGSVARRPGALPLAPRSRSDLSSVNMGLRHVASDLKKLHSSGGSCSRAKYPLFLLFAGGNLSITEQR